MTVASQQQRLRDYLRGEILEVRGEDDSTGGLVRILLRLRRRDGPATVTGWVAIDCLPATSGPFIDIDTVSQEEADLALR